MSGPELILLVLCYLNMQWPWKFFRQLYPKQYHGTYPSFLYFSTLPWMVSSVSFSNKTNNFWPSKMLKSKLCFLYFYRRISHRTHHQNHGNVDNDESWVPVIVFLNFLLVIYITCLSWAWNDYCLCSIYSVAREAIQ